VSVSGDTLIERRWITLLIAIAALASYGFGFEHSAWGLVAVGMALELWFWIRVWPRRSEAPPQPT
jgi:hypothetical protein